MGEVQAWFEDFDFDASGLNYPAPSEELWVQSLRTEERQIIGPAATSVREARLEDYLVSALIDFDDVSYDQNANLLYKLAGQAIAHFRRNLDEVDVERVVRVNQRRIANAIHSQMQPHYREVAGELEAKVSSGFTELKDYAYTKSSDVRDFRVSPADKSKMGQYLFGGFQRSLYPVQKFHSDAERTLAVVLDRDAGKWFRPVSGQFQMTYRLDGELHSYQPDFVAELGGHIAMIEVKARNQLDSADVLAKQDTGVAWCRHATEHTASFGGKPWVYALIPHDEIAENLSADFIVRQHSIARTLA